MKEKILNFLNKIKISLKVSWHRIWIPVVVFVALFGVLFVASIAYSETYKDKVLPGIYLGDFYIGGLKYDELYSYLQKMSEKLNDEGVEIIFEIDGKKENVNIKPVIISNDEYIEIIKFDVDKEVNRLLEYKKENNILIRAISTIQTKLLKPKLSVASIIFNKEKLTEVLQDKLSPYETEAKNASVKISSVDPLQYEISSSTPGIQIDNDLIIKEIIAKWSHLQSPYITAPVNVEQPKITEDLVEQIDERLSKVFSGGDLELNYTDPHTKRNFSWLIKLNDIAGWLDVQEGENGLAFGLSNASTTEFFQEKIISLINVEAKNAKFEMQDGRVIEFQGSRPGVTLDVEKTYYDINKAVMQRTWHDEGLINAVTVTAKQVEPEIKTGEVNDLGINEILGVGYSNFSGSSINRIKNISFAAKNKLNGLLIKPGEEFSMLASLRPFTIEGGYLSELVIKGDKIKPVVGGGLCQIGTTMFRAAMNSGMPILQRSNHSLVVSYYNDVSNGNPGTDATIYDPAPDFKFKNDTGNYILISADVNSATGDLYFTLWGTSDGRKAYYSPPVILNWIPTGPTREIETTDLAPGQRQCQSRHVGANTIFTYTRELADGQIEKRDFTSYYRPLPQICLVGVEAMPEVVCEDGQECLVDLVDEVIELEVLDSDEGE